MPDMAASTASIWAPAPPEHWYLTDDFNMPVTADTQRRENTLQSVFEAYVARRGRAASIARAPTTAAPSAERSATTRATFTFEAEAVHLRS